MCPHPPLEHVGQKRAREQDGGDQVDLYGLDDVCVLQGDEIPDTFHAGVVDEDVDAVMRASDRLRESVTFGHVAEIAHFDCNVDAGCASDALNLLQVGPRAGNQH